MQKHLPAIVIFLGSFLLFGLQPMLGRTLLPSFGGTAAVWVVCLCAYQVLLLAGYGYAHRLSGRRESGEGAKVLHLSLLAFSVLWVAALAWLRPQAKAYIGNSGHPALEVLLCVLVFVGLPYVLLSANASLVQAWVAKAAQGLAGSPSGGNKKDVYRLYAVSNLGSFCGLLFYPFVLEPYVALTVQWYGFAACLAVYAALLALLANGLARGGRPGVKGPQRAGEGSGTPAPAGRAGTGVNKVLWVLLPATSTFLLNALTTHLTLNVLPMPLLWVLLLGLFLLSYVIGFTGKAERHVTWLAGLALLAAVATAGVFERFDGMMAFSTSLAACGALCLFGCSFLHAWLCRARPEEDRLTDYYFCGALGGACGGVLASLVAPMLFSKITEYPLAILAVFGWLAAYALTNAAEWRKGARACAVSLVCAAAAAAVWLMLIPKPGGPDRVVCQKRGFFGTITVLEMKAVTSATGLEGVVRNYLHGTIVHGVQVHIPGKERMPTTYYTPSSSGYAIVGHPKYKTGEPMRVNITGLGIGVLFCYGRPQDYYRAYEISKDAIDVALNTNLFTFVSGCPAKTDIVLGDARKGLEKELAEGAEAYDVIVVDAFTGDNLPYHLSTLEAFDVYFKLLKPDGVLAVNISNWHLDLEPFMKALGDHYGIPLMGLRTEGHAEKMEFPTGVVVFCRKPEGMAPPPGGAHVIDVGRSRTFSPLPTDEKGSFISLINW